MDIAIFSDHGAFLFRYFHIIGGVAQMLWHAFHLFFSGVSSLVLIFRHNPVNPSLRQQVPASVAMRI